MMECQKENPSYHADRYGPEWMHNHENKQAGWLSTPLDRAETTSWIGDLSHEQKNPVMHPVGFDPTATP